MTEHTPEKVAGREVLTPVYPASLGPVGEELVRILSRIPEHTKED